MNLKDLREKNSVKNFGKLSDYKKYALTLEFRRKVDEAYRAIESFYGLCKNPVISCGGGKDGTAAAILAKHVCGDVKIVCANPPNPLPDRTDHIEVLKKYIDAQWHDVSYDWNVDAVLCGDKKYPENLKIDKLDQWAKDNAVDGVLFGIRAAESAARRINLARNGLVYTTKGGVRCQPIARWTAQESLCLALLEDAPINPVYIKMDGVGDTEHLHDGTWWPHGTMDRAGWIKRYYPDFYERYTEALKVYAGKFKPCEY